jgi:prepilin-type N-terminal cleavage/methylation domain-containing protein
MKTLCRRGFSLLEVMIATGILLGAVLVLGELAGLGQRHSSTAEDLANAQWICQNKLNEILAGVASLDAVDSAPLDDDVGWSYSVDVEPVGQVGLTSVRVTVFQDGGLNRSPQQFSLVRWLRDPNYQASANPADQGDNANSSGNANADPLAPRMPSAGGTSP